MTDTSGNVCKYCTGNHTSTSCPHKGTIQEYKCANCGKNHSSTYMKCSVVQKQLDSLLQRTKGMEGRSKNDVHPYSIVT